MLVPMDLLEFRNGTYRSPPREVGWFARWFPSLAFHARFVMIVWRCYRKAVRGNYDGRAWAESSRAVMRALESVGVQFEITGMDHLRSVEGACLVIGNHMSSLETMVLPCLTQPVNETTFVIKQSLLTYPGFKHVMRSRDPVAVTQTDPRADFKTMMSAGPERLARGISLIVFPEGERRTPPFNPQQFNSIGVKLAARTGLPIVPFALQSDAWGPSKLFGDFGPIDPAKKVHFAFGEPIHVSGRGTEEQQQIIRFIQTKLAEWQEYDRCIAAHATESV